MPVFLLPKLSENAPKPTKTGQWEESANINNFLIGLADDLVVAKNAKKTYGIDSIPDIWAKPLFFQMALYASATDAHQNFDVGIHEKVQGEWRALLAMLALHEVRHLNITVDTVNLTNINANDFESMLIALAPKDSVTGNAADWHDIYIISYRNEPLAITSPTTLVAAAADYSNTLAGKLTEPWSDDGRHLTDPITYLESDELSGLYYWLKDLYDSLHNHISKPNDTCLQLLKKLDDYMKDIGKQANEKGVQLIAKTIVPANLNINIGIFQYLNKKVQAPPATPTTSAVRIIQSKARSTAKPLLLVSPEMLQKISTSRGIPLAQLTVWAGITAVDINEQSLAYGNAMINGVPLEGAEWRRPEDFFTEKLLVLQGGKNFKVNNETSFNIINVRGSDVLMTNHNMSVILPLRKEILEYFEPDEIAKKLYIEKDGNYINVKFTFPLSGKNGKTIDYTAEKSYQLNNEDEVIYRYATVPAIEIWPNFKRPGWHKYYLYYENPEAQNNINETASNFFYVYPWAYGKPNLTNDVPLQGLANLYTAKLSDFPEALICTTNDGISNVEVGFILLVQPQSKSITTGNSWQIGIDFGTSSTMIYFRNARNAPQPLILKPNLFQVTNSDVIRTRTFQNFIRSKISEHEDGSFLSIFQLLNDNGANDNGAAGLMPSIRPLQDGNVLWLQSADGEDADYFRETKKQIDPNLKWKDDPLVNLKVEAYIKQICLQCLVEAAQNGVGNISWNFSYPTAFSPHQQMTFSATCDGAVDDALQGSGFNAGSIEHFTETQGAAYYFSKFGGVNLAGGAVCLDIGAGTTDISIISGMPPKVVFHTSLKFAGRCLFKSIYKNYDVFCNTIQRPQPLNLGTMSEDSEQRDALIDADMRKYSRDYLRKLNIISGQRPVQKALQISQFAMAGLFHYVGNLINFLHQNGIYKEDNVPRIYIGGNGSRILSWICGGSFSNKNSYMSVFKDIFVDSSNLSLTFGFNLVLSNTPKIEVSCGMVEDMPFTTPDFFDADAIALKIHGSNGTDPIIADSVFAGDNFIFNDKEQDKTGFISAYEIKKGISIESAKELKILADKFNSHRCIWDRGNRIDTSNDILANVALAVYGFYAQQFGIGAANISVEPVFILELKKFLEMLL